MASRLRLNELEAKDTGRVLEVDKIATVLTSAVDEQVYPTLTALVSAPTLPVNTVVRTLGYSEVGDGGGSAYRIRANGSVSTDGGYRVQINGRIAENNFPNGYATPRMYGCPIDGAGNAGPAVTAMYTAPVSEFLFTDGDYLFTTEGTCNRGNVNTRCTAGVRILTPSDPSGGFYSVRFEGPGPTGSIVNISSTTEVDGYSHIITSSAHGLERGDYFRVLSDDYFSGYDGYSGYGRRNKGEYAKVRDVISATEIRVQDALIFDYDPSSSKTIQKVVFAENVHWTGGHLVGPGGFTGPRPTRERGIGFNNIRNFSMCKMTTENLTHQAGRGTNSLNGFISLCSFDGPDTYDVTNTPTPDERWAKGFEVHSSSNVTMFKCTGTNLRRILDVESFATGVIAADCAQVRCEVGGSWHVVSNHTAFRFLADGNYGTCRNGIALRSVDNTIINNRIRVLAGYTAIRVGRGVRPTSLTGPNMWQGSLECHNNRIFGNTERYVYLNGSFSSVKVSGLIAEEGVAAREAFYHEGRHIGDVTFLNCHLPVNNSATPDGIALFGYDNGKGSGIPNLSCGSLTVKDCKFPGVSSYVLAHLGTQYGKGTGNFTFKDNEFGEITAWTFAMRIFGSGLTNYGTQGVHGGRLIAEDNVFEKVRPYTDQETNPIMWLNGSTQKFVWPRIRRNWVKDTAEYLELLPRTNSDLTNRFSSAYLRQGEFTFLKGERIEFSDPSGGNFLAVVTKAGTTRDSVSTNRVAFSSASGSAGSDVVSGTPYSTVGIHPGMVLLVSGTSTEYVVKEVLNDSASSIRLDRPLEASLSGELWHALAEWTLIPS